MNAMGYRSTDRSLYGWRVTSKPGVVKVNPTTGAGTFLGLPKGAPAKLNAIAGDVHPDGSAYYVYATGTGVLWKVDLKTFTATSVKLSLKPELPDFAVSPTDNNLYGVAKDGRLAKIDPRTGKVTLTRVPELGAGGYGATWFTAKGD